MSPPDNINGSRRAIDAMLVQHLEKIEEKLDKFQLETEHRVTKLETYATVRGMIGGAITTALTAIAGAIIWFLKG